MGARRIIAFACITTIFLSGGLSVAQASHSGPKTPKTVEEAVTLLKAELSPTDREYILRTPRDHVTAALHMSLGLRIRNGFKLWGGNQQLMKSCGANHPDDCSGIIVGRLWDSIRSDAAPTLVRQLDCQFQLIESVQINYAHFDELTTGQLLKTLQDQIDAQISKMKENGINVCQSVLKLRVLGDPKEECFVRAEFAREGGKTEVSLDRLFGWIGWRNDFAVLNEPPEISLKFRNTCAWPSHPRF